METGQEISIYKKFGILILIVINWILILAFTFYLFQYYVSQTRLDFVFMSLLFFSASFLLSFLLTKKITYINDFNNIYIQYNNIARYIITISVVLATYRILYMFVEFNFVINIVDAIDILKIIINIDTIFIGLLGLSYKELKEIRDSSISISILASFLFLLLSILYSIYNIAYIPTIDPSKLKINATVLNTSIQSMLLGISTFIITIFTSKNKKENV